MREAARLRVRGNLRAAAIAITAVAGALLLASQAHSVPALPAPSLIPLGDLPGGGYESRARGVSRDGSVVVGVSRSASGDEAFRWTGGGGMVGLGDLPGGHFISSAEGASGDGSVVVGYGRSDTLIEAFRWSSGGGMVGLGDLPGGDFQSNAYGVSGDGSVVVGFGHYSAARRQAFRWTSDTGMVALGDLPGGDTQSFAYGISGDGAVVVGYGYSASGVEAFRWTSGGGMVGLGDLPGGEFSSKAFGVSGDGSVVVGQGVSASRIEAFRWTSGGGMERLWDVLLSHGINPDASGWTLLEEARGVSLDGNVIVGSGRHNGAREAFVAVIPEPSLALLVLGGFAGLRRAPKAHINTENEKDKTKKGISTLSTRERGRPTVAHAARA